MHSFIHFFIFLYIFFLITCLFFYSFFIYLLIYLFTYNDIHIPFKPTGLAAFYMSSPLGKRENLI